MRPSPSPARATNFLLTVTAALTNVFVQLNGGGWTSAATVNGWTNWTANVTLTPGSNTVSAYAVNGYGSFSPTNSVMLDYASSAQFAAPPGIPVSGFANAGGTFVVTSIGGGIGVQPITNNAEQFFANATAFAGDVVFLINTNNGTSPTNWAAVLRFVNPADPTGTNGLFATEYETFFQTNADPNYFSGFSLLPNVAYLPIIQTNADGSIEAYTIVFGPVGGILSGQEALILYTASHSTQHRRGFEHSSIGTERDFDLVRRRGGLHFGIHHQPRFPDSLECCFPVAGHPQRPEHRDQSHRRHPNVLPVKPVTITTNQWNIHENPH